MLVLRGAAECVERQSHRTGSRAATREKKNSEQTHRDVLGMLSREESWMHKVSTVKCAAALHVKKEADTRRYVCICSSVHQIKKKNKNRIILQICRDRLSTGGGWEKDGNLVTGMRREGHFSEHTLLPSRGF